MLLLAIGPYLVKGKQTVSIVVRAKYLEALVRKTDWAKVSPTKILRMSDGKRAAIVPAYQ